MYTTTLEKDPVVKRIRALNAVCRIDQIIEWQNGRERPDEAKVERLQDVREDILLSVGIDVVR